jgi:uncharacterized integral membrane protein
MLLKICNNITMIIKKYFDNCLINKSRAKSKYDIIIIIIIILMVVAPVINCITKTPLVT